MQVAMLGAERDLGLLIGGLVIRASVKTIKRQDAAVAYENGRVLKAEADRQRFESRLNSSLAMAETEEEACVLIKEVMAELNSNLNFDLSR